LICHSALPASAAWMGSTFARRTVLTRSTLQGPARAAQPGGARRGRGNGALPRARPAPLHPAGPGPAERAQPVCGAHPGGDGALSSYHRARVLRRCAPLHGYKFFEFALRWSPPCVRFFGVCVPHHVYVTCARRKCSVVKLHQGTLYHPDVQDRSCSAHADRTAAVIERFGCMSTVPQCAHWVATVVQCSDPCTVMEDKPKTSCRPALRGGGDDRRQGASEGAADSDGAAQGAPAGGRACGHRGRVPRLRRPRAGTLFQMTLFCLSLLCLLVAAFCIGGPSAHSTLRCASHCVEGC
jgi:hypothetical protein